MSSTFDPARRRFLGTAAVTLAATRLGAVTLSQADARTAGSVDPPVRAPRPVPAFGPVRQVNAGLLNVGYVDEGPADGPAVVLLHGWPYDIYTYAEVTSLLAAKGYRVIVPYLRGFGTTHFLSSSTARLGQPSVLALDIIALMDTLGIEKAIIGGCDWGARTANIIGALWPERCQAMVAVSGYLIGSQAAGRLPLPPEGRAPVVVPVLFCDGARRGGLCHVSTRFCPVDLAACVAPVELRRGHV